ncbi:MAG: lysophospholipid acyltransferase family protein [Acidobacteria bacterium]|nr:lysophospholipid acyltransferase family protein [Acidobacteriota bacterium]
MAEGKYRSSLRNWLEYGLVRFLLAALGWAPHPVALWLAQGCMRMVDLLVPRLRRTGYSNLEFAFPHLDAAGRERLIDGVFRSLARLAVTLARFPRLNRANIGGWIRYQGFEHFEQARQCGRGVLFYTAHLGNWELSAAAHALMSAPMYVMVRPLDNPLLDRMAEHYRTLCGNRLIEKKDYARRMLKALEANQAVGILADQNAAEGEGVFVEFFGKQACAHTGLARLAAHSQAPVIPGFALWSDAERRYILRFDPPLEMTGDAARDTQRLHRHLESVIREYPDQWLWIHRRWKTRPPGEAALY